MNNENRIDWARIHLFYKVLWEDNYLLGDLCRYWETGQLSVLRGVYFRYRKTVFRTTPQALVMPLLERQDAEALITLYLAAWKAYIEQLEIEFGPAFAGV